MASIEGAAQAYVQHEVLGYLARRPGACDTIEGIINWWLYDQRRALGPETILAAVDSLVAQGALHERRTQSGDLLYAAPPGAVRPQQQE